MQGHGDFELSAIGKAQAQRLAQRLLAESWVPSSIYSSPLKRTAQTAEILVNHFLTAPLPSAVSDLIDSGEVSSPTTPTQDSLKTVKIQYSDDLKEFQNGIFQGLTWAEAQERHPQLCQALEASPDWIPIPGAESLQEARDRARHFIQDILTHHQESDRLWIITHSWILQHLVAELLGCDRSWRLHAHNTALFEFWIDRSRWHCTDQNRLNTDLWQIQRFNDDRHLWESDR